MQPARDRPVVATVRGWWPRYGTAVIAFAVLAMFAAACWRLGNELPRLLYDPDGAFDLRLRHREVHRWVEGSEVYGDVERGDYPPASYLILWPLLGWLGPGPARWLWGATGVAGLGWLAVLMVRGSGARTRLEALFVALLPFSVYASSATLSMGQLINHVLPVLLAGLFLLRREGGRWSDDLLGSAMLVAALVKPTLSAPFYWIALFATRRLRPMVLVGLGYLALTALSVSFQSGPLIDTLTGWLAERPQALHGHTNIHKLLALMGLQEWMLPVSLGILLLSGWWICRHRRADYWILLGVAGLVAQFWAHHRLYDHLLILVPMVTLLRLSWRRPTSSRVGVVPALLFGLTWITVHAPATWLDAAPPLSTFMETVQAAVWLAVLIFLVRAARTSATSANGAPGPHSRPGRPDRPATRP